MYDYDATVNRKQKASVTRTDVVFGKDNQQRTGVDMVELLTEVDIYYRLTIANAMRDEHFEHAHGGVHD